MKDSDLLALIDVEEMLNELGLRNVRDTYSDEVQFSCPFPGHLHLDSSPSASMSKVERPIKHMPGRFYPPTTYNCFGCGRSGTAITFVSEFEGVSVLVARRWLIERFAPNFSPEEVTSMTDAITSILSDARKNPGARGMPILDESEVEEREVDWPQVYCEWEQTRDSPAPFNYMLDRGFEPETLMDFQIGYDVYSSRFSIPVRNENGDLVGFKGRAWWEGAKPKYKALGGEGYGFETCEFSRVLFALCIAKDHMVPYRPMIVREGEFNTIAMHQMGFFNTAGVSGSNLSQTQIDLIKKYADSAIMYFDRLEDGLKAASKLDDCMPVTVCQEYERDPAEASRFEVATLLKTAESSLVLSIR